METILPILIAIVIFAFQAYANFQKEQEKARKRNPGRPPLPEDNAYLPIPPAPVTIPQPAASVPRAFDAYSGVFDTEQAARMQRSGRNPVIPKRLALNEELHAQTTANAEKFDLRDAVIKSIILERPYQ